MGDLLPHVSGVYAAGDLSNTYTVISMGGRQWLVLSIEFCTRDLVMAWAESVIQAHSGMPTIIIDHAFMWRDGTIYDGTYGGGQLFDPVGYNWTTSEGIATGTDVEAALITPYPQVKFVMCGHAMFGHSHLTKTRAGGSKWHGFQQDYQSFDNGTDDYEGYDHAGWMQLLTLDWDNDTIHGCVYAPYLNQYYDGRYAPLKDSTYSADPTSATSNSILMQNAGIR
jgi:hypothetical protein